MLKKSVKKILKFIKNKNNKLKKEGDFYYKFYEGINIYSHNSECIERAFSQIFVKNIYNFESRVNNPLIIDAGANIGLGVLYWKKKFPRARIIAFEPSVLAFKSLLKNVEENKLSDVICINKALSDSIGKQKFTTNEIISGSLITDKNLEINYEVETTTLGGYLNEKVDLLKIDIEGAEKYIFNDIKNNISNLNHIFLEYHSFVNEAQYLSKYLNLFEENNFRYFIQDEYKKTNHFINKKVSLSQDMQLNLWASKQNS